MHVATRREVIFAPTGRFHYPSHDCACRRRRHQGRYRFNSSTFECMEESRVKSDRSAGAARADDAVEKQPEFADERRQRIVGIVQARGRVRVRDLATLLGVTEPTVRKDITDLASARLLKRVHGAAVAITPSTELDISERVGTNAAAKAAIARACLEEIVDGDAVFFDSGTTVSALAGLLGSSGQDRVDGVRVPQNVNVLTNSIDVARSLANSPTVRHTVVGGQYRTAGGSFVGPLAISALQQFTLNTAFIGVSGLNEVGLTVADLSEAQVKRTAMEQARRVIVPMDNSKVGVSDFAIVCALSNVDVLITDQSNPELEQLCAENDVRFVVAK
ncbi:DeoR/GlpR family DNA-binding transcription regulator [Rhodococcus sp. NPDC057529]|uniref:DeoR/GlpR family DNA-binding transcription regulator n=1 Tax=Rhodococcus sp. NPDC057529 TaxID=3346158 RepID=UPI003672C012